MKLFDKIFKKQSKATEDKVQDEFSTMGKYERIRIRQVRAEIEREERLEKAKLANNSELANSPKLEDEPNLEK